MDEFFFLPGYETPEMTIVNRVSIQSQEVAQSLLVLFYLWILTLLTVMLTVQSVSLAVACLKSGIGHLSPFWTTRFLQVLQQEQAWLHSNSTGGSL